MVLQLHWIRYTNLCNPLFPRPAPHFLSPLRSLLRQYFLPRVSYPLIPYALGSSVGDSRTHSRGTSLAAIFTQHSCVSGVLGDGKLVECVVEG
jgi:hypothetical protein